MRSFKYFMLCTIVAIIAFSNLSFAGWVQDGTLWKYEENGSFKTNDWLEVEGNYYYFDSASHMVSGLQKIGDSYYAFHDNGIAYKRKEKIVIDEVQYDIATKGKVVDLENDMTDEDFAKYIANKALEEENNKKFAAAQKAFNESVAAERAVQEMQQALILESQRAENAAAQALINESIKARQEYLLSAEDDANLVAAANRGTASKPVVDNLTKEVTRQITLRKIELIGKAKEIRKQNPMAEISQVEVDFNDIINAYASRIDELLQITFAKYKVNDDKKSGYIEDFAALFSNMKSSFSEALDQAVG